MSSADTDDPQVEAVFPVDLPSSIISRPRSPVLIDTSVDPTSSSFQQDPTLHSGTSHEENSSSSSKAEVSQHDSPHHHHHHKQRPHHYRSTFPSSSSPPRPTITSRPQSARKIRRPFLTSSQLADIFHRLDKNHDGELDLIEFIGVIRMLKLTHDDIDEDFIAHVFRTVDSKSSGSLDLQEFIVSYQMIFTFVEEKEKNDQHRLQREMMKQQLSVRLKKIDEKISSVKTAWSYFSPLWGGNSDKDSAKKKTEEKEDAKVNRPWSAGKKKAPPPPEHQGFIRATRYGFDSNGRPIFELYTVPIASVSTTAAYGRHRGPKRRRRKCSSDSDSCSSDSDEDMQEPIDTSAEAGKKYTFSLYSTSLRQASRLMAMPTMEQMLEECFDSVQVEDYLDGMEGLNRMIHLDSATHFTAAPQTVNNKEQKSSAPSSSGTQHSESDIESKGRVDGTIVAPISVSQEASSACSSDTDSDAGEAVGAVGIAHAESDSDSETDSQHVANKVLPFIVHPAESPLIGNRERKGLSSKQLNESTIAPVVPKETIHTSSTIEPLPMHQPEHTASDAQVPVRPSVAFFSKTEDIHGIVGDKQHTPGIFWWIDIAFAKIERSSITRIVHSFGLPNDARFMSHYNDYTFDHVLHHDSKARVCLGQGFARASRKHPNRGDNASGKLEGEMDGSPHTVYSMNMFVQALTLQDRPVYHMWPAEIERLLTKFMPSFKEYYETKLAFLWNFSTLTDTSLVEQSSSYQAASIIVDRLREDPASTNPLYCNEDSDEEGLSDSSSDSDGERDPNIDKKDNDDSDNEEHGLMSLHINKSKSQYIHDQEESIKHKTHYCLSFIRTLYRLFHGIFSRAIATLFTACGLSLMCSTRRDAKIYTTTSTHSGIDKNTPSFGIVEGRGKALPIAIPSKRRYRYVTQPTWLASSSQLATRPPLLNYDTISLHILEHQQPMGIGSTGQRGTTGVRQRRGNIGDPIGLSAKAKAGVPRETPITTEASELIRKAGPHALVTIRKIEDEVLPAMFTVKGRPIGPSGMPSEKQIKRSIEERSRCGVMGRLVDGLWTKLLENMLMNGVSNIASELDDGPAPLASFLITMVHSYSMTNLGSLEYWKNLVEKEVNDVPVSKHPVHVSELRRVIKEFHMYVDPIHKIFSDLIKEWEQEQYRIQKRKQAEQEALMKATNKHQKNNKHRAGALSLSKHNKGKSTSSTTSLPALATTSVSLLGHRGHRLRDYAEPPPPVSARGMIRSQHHKRENDPNKPDEDWNPYIGLDIDTLPLGYRYIKRFLGNDHNQCHRELKMCLEGYDVTDFKGLIYWQDRLSKLDHSLSDDVEHVFEHQVEEKRAFLSFIVTIVTILCSPISIATGYFGMNFDNMSVLHADTYPMLPGVKLLWAILLVFYGLIFVVGMHYRVFYAAT